MLEPEERARQACILKGLSVVQRSTQLRNADRIKSSIFSGAKLEGTHLVAKGGAVRAKGRWYAVSFECHLSPDLMRAYDFSFSVGDEVPKGKWASLNLWE